jgi:DNA-binding GntR family transcriptional regulator
MSLSAVQKRAIREIVAYIRRENLPLGAHLTELQLAGMIGTSRTPIQAALAHLAKIGIVQRDPNRGFFLAGGPAELDLAAQKWMTGAEDPLYLKIADARLHGKLPDTVTEASLVRIFHVSRSVIRGTLSRIQQEGWVERRSGHGWFFLPTIDSAEAYEESYNFRMAIEPAGLLSTAFAPDRTLLEATRRQQELIVNGGFSTMTAIELFEANARFHENLASCSGNRFILQSIRRLNQLRRLVEYRQAAKPRLPRKTQAEEHLAILDEIERGEMIGAASRLRQHLNAARGQKVAAGVL